MPATKAAPAAKRATEATGRRGTAALDGLEISLDEAEKALTELRHDLSTGGRRLVKDVDTAIKSARRDLQRSRKAIQADLGDLGGALTPRRVAPKPAKPTAAPAAVKRTPARKAPATKS
jgi:hypothetical protein